MARKFLTPIDLQQNELQNGIIQNLATAPASPKIGQLYFLTTTNTPMSWNGTAWMALDASQQVGTIPMAALSTNPLARANHTGTQLSATISDLASNITTTKLSAFAAPIANVAMGGFTLTGLATPSAAGQAAEYSWVVGQIQAAAAGISSKDAVNAVSTANIATLSGLVTVDGVSLVAGNRVLLTGQTTTTQNGVYVIAAGAWTRPTTEGSVTGEMDFGATWLSTGGTVYTGALFRMATTAAITVGTTAISIVQFSVGGTYTAGTNGGISITAGAISVLTPANSGLLLGASGVYVDTSIHTQKNYSTITGTGAQTVFNVTHAVASGLDVQVQVYEISSGATVEVDMARSSTTQVTVTFATAPANAKAYRVLIQG
jgi:hypothetical protein